MTLYVVNDKQSGKITSDKNNIVVFSNNTLHATKKNTLYKKKSVQDFVYD